MPKGDVSKIGQRCWQIWIAVGKHKVVDDEAVHKVSAKRRQEQRMLRGRNIWKGSPNYVHSNRNSCRRNLIRNSEMFVVTALMRIVID